MVKKYVILANSSDKRFDVPRQLLELNGEKLVARTIRLLKENGIEDIILTASDKRFYDLGAEVFVPNKSDYNYENGTGYWLNAFPYELMDEPVCFIWGDVYFSEKAIKTIVNTETNKNLFFCTYNNRSTQYIKTHDEPLAFKVVDPEEFKKHIEICKKAKDDKTACREPVIWEVYRSMHGLNINEHKMTEDYVVINDISCDIDGCRDLDRLKLKLETNYKYKLSIIIAYYKTYEYVTKILERLIPQLTDEVEVILVDDGCHETRLDKYKEIKIIHLEENKGGASAMNEGIINSKGKYIGFIDSDDYISEDYVESLINMINESTADTIFMDWQDMESKEIHYRPDNYAQWKCIYKRTVIPLFVDGRKYSFDVPFYDELNTKDYTKDYVDKTLYYYNSGNPNNLTHEKAQVIAKEREKNMVKVEVIGEFTLEKFNELKNIERVNKDTFGRLYVKDKFECTKEMADYLLGNNKLNKAFVKVIEVIPEKKEEPAIDPDVVIETPKVETKSKPKKKRKK